jgi:hypothetical protein
MRKGRNKKGKKVRKRDFKTGKTICKKKKKEKKLST